MALRNALGRPPTSPALSSCSTSELLYLNEPFGLASDQAGRKRPRQEGSSPTLCISPSTPDRSRAVTPVCDDVEVGWLSSTYVLLADWLAAIKGLHPACELIPDETVLLALGIFRKYAAAVSLSPQQAALQPLVAQSVTAACLWVSIKFLAMPSCVPDSKFLFRATGVHFKLLLKLEPEVLRAIGWDMLAVCKALNMWKSGTADNELGAGGSSLQ